MVSLYDAFGKAKSDGGFFDTWLDGAWDEAKENTWMILRSLPVVGNFVKISEARTDQREYKDRYNITPGENYHPWRLPSADKQSGAVSGVVNFVSDNIKRLYK